MNEIRDRIKEMIEEEGVNQASFSKQCDIKPATLNHILTGRNSPSSQIVQKILSSYPQYRAEWLINGILPMKKTEEGMGGEMLYGGASSLFEEFPSKKKDESKNGQNNRLPPFSHTVAVAKKTRAISKIIIFYDDNTFETYIPEN